MASAAVLDTSFLIGFEKITAGIRCLSIARAIFCFGITFPFSAKSVVVEILETMEPDQDVIDACRRLKGKGYMIALDDFEDNAGWAPLVEIADFIKVDFRLTRLNSAISCSNMPEEGSVCWLKKWRLMRNTRRHANGIHPVPGFFFCRPEMMHHRALPAFKMTYLELLRAATAPEFDIRKLASSISHEASLTFRLLRYLNSPVFGLRSEIRSVPHALSLLGERELRKWIAVVSIGVMAEGKPDELMTVPLVRGRFCELLAPIAGLPEHASDLFFMGLLSVMDAILDQPLDTILAELPVRREIKDALETRTGLYWQLLEIAIAHERGDWEKVSVLLSGTGMKEDQVSSMYVASVDWSTALRRGISAPVAR